MRPSGVAVRLQRARPGLGTCHARLGSLREKPRRVRGDRLPLVWIFLGWMVLWGLIGLGIIAIGEVSKWTRADVIPAATDARGPDLPLVFP